LKFEADEGGSVDLVGKLDQVPGARAQVILTGSLDQIHGHPPASALRIEMSYGMLTTGRKIALWIRHLVFCASSPDGHQNGSVLVVRGNPRESEGVETFELSPLHPADARRLLARLCRLAVVGLARPLPFFPGVSEAYFQALSSPPKKLSEEEVIPYAFREARKRLWPERGATDAALVEVYRGRDPLGDLDAQGRPAVHEADLGELPFALLAETLFHPMHRAVRRGAGS
jgi:exonuclease V gamma subunit